MTSKETNRIAFLILKERYDDNEKRIIDWNMQIKEAKKVNEEIEGALKTLLDKVCAKCQGRKEIIVFDGGDSKFETCDLCKGSGVR